MGVHCSAYATLHSKLREWSEANSYPENILANLPRSLLGGAASSILIRTGPLLPPPLSPLGCVLQQQFPVGSEYCDAGRRQRAFAERRSHLVKVNLSVKQTTLQTAGAPVTSEPHRASRREPRPSHLALLLPTTLGTLTRRWCVCGSIKDKCKKNNNKTTEGEQERQLRCTTLTLLANYLCLDSSWLSERRNIGVKLKTNKTKNIAVNSSMFNQNFTSNYRIQKKWSNY